MPDNANFAKNRNELQRDSEMIEDRCNLIEEAFLNGVGKRFLGEESSLVAKVHGGDIFTKACSALLNNNIKEASHQLKREIDYCEASPTLVKSPFEISAKAGLKAINEHKSADAVYHIIQEVWLNAWAENPRFFDILEP